MCLEAVMRNESPCGWEQDLAWRMSLAAPEDMVRGRLFNSALATVEKWGDAGAVRSCREATGEACFLDSFNYPLRAFLRLLARAASLLAERLGGGEAVLRELGRHVNTGFMSSPVGRLALLMTYGSPKRMMDSVPDIYRQSTSFGEYEVVWTGPSSGRLLLRGDLLPGACHEGVLESLLRSAGGRGVRVLRQWERGLDGEYTFSWGE